MVKLIPTAKIGSAPYGATLVNIKTVIWVDAPETRTLAPFTLLGQRVAVTLTLNHVRYDYGDGHTGSRTTASRPYPRAQDPCETSAICPGWDGHTYLDTGAVTLTATAYWHATFTVDGGAAITIPGTVAGPTDRDPLIVKQARGVLVAPPAQH